MTGVFWWPIAVDLTPAAHCIAHNSLHWIYRLQRYAKNTPRSGGKSWWQECFGPWSGAIWSFWPLFDPFLTLPAPRTQKRANFYKLFEVFGKNGGLLPKKFCHFFKTRGGAREKFKIWPFLCFLTIFAGELTKKWSKNDVFLRNLPIKPKFLRQITVKNIKIQAKWGLFPKAEPSAHAIFERISKKRAKPSKKHTQNPYLGDGS